MREDDRPSSTVFRRGARGTIDIVADVLRQCKNWRNRTGIMYQASLSYEMLQFYIWYLVELELLVESRDRRFRITTKGSDFLSTYTRLTEFLTSRRLTADTEFTTRGENRSPIGGKNRRPAKS
jgi:predicted transcriptional regulator